MDEYLERALNPVTARDTITPFGRYSVDRSKGLSGQDWLRSQSDIQAAAFDPSGVAPDPFAGRNYDEGVLFSGTGTQADLEGRAQARQMMDAASAIPDYEAKLRELKLMQAQRQAEDPYGLAAYGLKEQIRKGTPSPRDLIAQQNQAQQAQEAEKIAKIEAAGRAAGRTPEEIDEAITKYIKQASLRRAFVSGKYGDVARMQDPFGG